VGVFVISSTLNFLDRALLNVLAPLIMAELHFNQTGFGFLISAFSLAYAASSLVTGWFLDRAGINRGITAAVCWWSAAAVSTALVRGFGGLAVCRAALGVGESAGVPAVGKLNGLYLKPEERALGAAVNQIGISLGTMIAALSVGFAVAHSWRLPFVITGLLGFFWVPVWLFVSSSIKPQYAAEIAGQIRPSFGLLRDRSLILLTISNVLWMGVYSLWMNWTSLYLIHVKNLTLKESASYVWIPPLVSNFGGFFGGWLSLQWIRRGVDIVVARRRAVWVSAVASLGTFALPLAPDARWATAIISLSLFFALAGSVNIYALPIDLFGAARSGLGIAALTCAYGVSQMFISPLIGYLGDHHLYTQVIWIATVPLILSAWVLQRIRPAERLV